MRWSTVFATLAAALISATANAGLTKPEISGLVEVEARSVEDFSGGKSTDLTLATMALRVDASLQQLITAHVGFLYEEDKTDFGLDEATITLGPSNGNSFTFGKMYIPFGRFDSLMVSDPQTLIMGESIETVMMLATDQPGGYASIYLFNGDSDETAVAAAGDDDTISGGFSFGRRDGDRYDLGVDYITNMGDSNTLQLLDTSPGSGTVGQVASSVPGVSIHLALRSGNTTFLAEQLMAMEAFSNGDLGGTVSKGEQPVATNIEIGFVREGGSVLAFGYQTTEEAQFIGMPKSVTSVVMRKAVMRGASLALEYAQMEDYSISDGGTGKTVDLFSLQIAMEF